MHPLGGVEMQLNRMTLMVMVAVLAVASLVANPVDASAQCTEACSVFHGEEGEVIGHGCVDFGDPTGQSGCGASSSGCTSHDCEPQMTMLLDDVGLPAPSVWVCGEAVVLAIAQSTPASRPMVDKALAAGSRGAQDD
jgi:hypothetical protein